MEFSEVAPSSQLCYLGCKRSGGSVRKGEDGMQRVALVLAVMAVTLVVASGVALAVNRVGTPRDDTIRGTNGPDQIDGRAGDDDIFSLGGRDTLYGGKGRDRLVGGPETGSGFLRSSG